MIFIDIDVHSISVAKQVVKVAQNLLIGTHEENTQVVVLALLKSVHRQEMRESLVRDKVAYLTIAVASDILQGGETVGALVEATQRNHGEHLVDSP